MASAPALPLEQLRRTLATVVLCVALAAFLTALTGDPFWRNLLYALCIGLSCHLLIELGRTLLLRWRHSADPEAGAWPGVVGMAAVVVLAAVAGSLFGAGLADWIGGGRQLQRMLAGSRALNFTLAVSLFACIIGTAWYWAGSQLAKARLRAEQAGREAVESHLKLLQSQLEPHMLFNTLANLRVLIGIDPARAQAMLDRLIAFLRTSLEASRSDRPWTLRQEFAHLDDYLALMAVRMGARLQMRMTLPPALADTPVPPLLLQPLVENAIRHGLEPKLEGGRIEVGAAAAAPGRLRLWVRDTGVGPGAAAGVASAAGVAASTRFGQQQVRDRLHVLHGAAAHFDLRAAGDAEGGSLATIDLPLPAGAQRQAGDAR